MIIFKRILLGLMILTAVLIGGVFLTLNLIDLNDYKGKIQSIAMEKTGRSLSIEGDIGLSYFPWAGISFGEISMANADEFGSSPFVQIDSARVKVKLLPLLKRIVTVDTIVLAGLKLDLQRAADGRTNWEDLIAAGNSDASTQTEGQSEPSSATTVDTTATTEIDPESRAETISTDDTLLKELSIDSIVIADAQIIWTDKQNGSDAQLTAFNLTSESIELSKPFGLTTDFTINSSSTGVEAKVNGKGEISIDLKNQQYQVKQLALSATAAGKAIPVENFSIEINGDIVADLLAQTATVSPLSVDSTGLVLAGELKITNLATNPTINAALKSNTFSPRNVAQKLNIELPATHDSKVLETALVTMGISASANSVALKELSIKLDDTNINGSATFSDLTRVVPPISFNLTIDELDLDRYLQEPSNSTSARTVTGATQQTVAEKPVPNVDGNSPIDIPVELLRQLEIEGVIKAGSLKASNLIVQNIEIPVIASNGKISLNDIKASLYEGELASSVAIDVTAPNPRYQFSTSATKIQTEQLLQDLLQDTAPVSGVAILASELSTAGNTANQLITNLNGHYVSDLTDGAINGINIGYQLRRAQSFFNNATSTAAEPNSKTDFSALHISAKINNGVIQSDDLDIRAPALRINGAGTVNLPQEFIDYTIKPKVVGSVKGQGGKDLEDLKGVAASIPIRGTFAELSTDFTGTIFAAMKKDYTNRAQDAAKALAKEERDKIKAMAKEKADVTKREAKEKLHAEQARLERKAKEKIGGQNEKIQKATDELKSQAKDKLKSLFK